MQRNSKTPFVLMILDGWGYEPSQEYNAIAAAHTPQWDYWWQTCPHMLLDASGENVGLPLGQMGNSEVGHMHIGAGRLILQDYTRINQAIADKTFQQISLLNQTLTDLKQQGKTLHIMGLFSPGGVHSHEDHLFAILDVCRAAKFTQIALHLFLDGRDTPPQSALPSLARLTTYLGQYPIATIASICGRYYAMDRDKRWERVTKAYTLLTEGNGENSFADASSAVSYYYEQGITDEFIPPTQIGIQTHPIQDGDAVFFFNFRADRARQLTAAFIDSTFTNFIPQKRPHLSHFLSMTPYADYLPTEAVFPTQNINATLGEVLAQHGLSQLRIAETEKYAHVTFFFNGGIETAFTLEDRVLIPSPQVATYDLQPEMSAPALTTTIVDAIKKQAYDVIICNYANADMVGHSGNFTATVKAIECLDQAMQAIGQALAEVGGQLLITADHGNAEHMFNPATKQRHTAHTTQPVPLLYVGNDAWTFAIDNGSLIDIAPTILTLLDLPIPHTMTGRSLMVKTYAA